MIDAFYFQRNAIRMELKNSAAAGTPENLDLVVTNRRVEDRRNRILLLRDDTLWKRTTINLAKVENTDLIQTAGVEVEDRRAAFIQTTGGIVKVVIPLVAGMAGAADLGAKCKAFPTQPCDLDPVRDLAMSKQGGTKTSGTTTLSWTEVPRSALPAVSFYGGVMSQPSRGLYYAACRGIDIILVTPTTTYRWTGKIADPRWLDFVAFPRKGNLRMHDQCGVSTTSEKDPTQPLDTVISAAVTQAIAIKDAIEKADKGDAK
ncbi:hypothetical protein FSB78_01555 [Sphingomonas ginsenosidivorax]|uniref:Uncharacterized protein n=1 Tax=Sphingomonas ginsenosidivorax TaxID=862135 RepID=A0A5C6U9Z9_9SPHN|nr:hypothetical protein [Sphingomonas ginsenosidivorax]TXC69787.1 hypothetical protein FSB78_01555 [Sphingomonas ginsenosidivorax]